MPIENSENEEKNFGVAREQFIPYSWKKTPAKCPPDPDETVWGSDEKWILQFDNIIKHPGGRAKGCECEIHVSSWRSRGGIGGSRYEEDGFKPIERKVVKTLQAKKPPSASLTSTPAVLSAGAVDEDFFVNAFEEVPTVQIYSNQELKEMINTIATTIGNPDMDWDKRVDAFKRIRSLLIAGAAGYDDFNELIKKWELPFLESLKDLRSHVVRETCVTIAYLAQNLGMKFGRFAEVVFPNLISLIQSSAKVIASAACTSIRFIIQNVHNQRLLPIINTNLTSRSREIRKAMCDVLDQLIHTWPLSILDKRVPLLQEAVKRGVSDADMEARISARRAYWAFKGYFPEQADALLATLDYAYKKNLYGDVSLSGSNSNLHQGTLPRQVSAPGRSRIPGSATGSVENLHHGFHATHQLLRRTPSLPRSRRSGIPVKTQESERSMSLDGRSSRRADLLVLEDEAERPSRALQTVKDALTEKVRSTESVKARRGSSSLTSYHPCFTIREPLKRKRLKSGKGAWKRGKKKAVCRRSPNWPQSFLEESIQDEMASMDEMGDQARAKFAPMDVSVRKSSPSLSRLCQYAFLPAPDHKCRSPMGDASGDFSFFPPFAKDDEPERIPMQRSLKKAAKLINNKIDANLRNVRSANYRPEICGSRRLDKIRWSSCKKRFGNTKDAETMTEFTGLPEKSNGSMGTSGEGDTENFLKKCPKSTDLYGVQYPKVRGSEKRETVEDVESKRFAAQNVSDSSKCLTFLFKNECWFFDGESESEDTHHISTRHQTVVLV